MIPRIALLTLVALSGCTRSPKEPVAHAEQEVLAPKDSEPRKTLVAMLNWHRENHSTFGRLQDEIVVFQVQGSDSTITTRDGYKLYETDSVLYKRLYYRVSKTNLERYLSFLKSSGYFTDNYLDSWRRHAAKNDSFMVQNPANDGPPSGFEFEWITYSQQWEAVTANPDTLTWYQSIRSDSSLRLSWSTQGVLGSSAGYVLVRNNGRWLIDSYPR